VVTVRDGAGNTITSSSAPVTVSIVSGTGGMSILSAGGLLGGTTTVNAVNGVVTFSDLTLTGQQGLGYVLRFSSLGKTPVDSAPIFVMPLNLVLTTPPVLGTSGALLTTQPVLAFQDGMGNTVTSLTAPVTAAIQSGVGGTLGGTTTVSAVNGVVTFTDLTLTGREGVGYVLQFSSPGVTSPAATPPVTLAMSGPPVGPGDLTGLTASQVGGQKPGSVLIYNLYTSGFNASANDSRISITNTSPSRRAYVHFFLIDGSNCSVADMTITLTPNQTTSFLASDFDPGVTGYLIAVATDENGCPTIQNDLIGESLVKLESGHRAVLPALGVAALGLGGELCNPGSTTATLAFDGVDYNTLPRTLAVSGLPSIANGYSSLLVVNRIGGNLTTGAEKLGSLFGLLFDDQEISQSFTLAGNVCQLRGVLGNNFPRTVPRYTSVIPAGRSGWMKFAAAADEAITGVVIQEGLDRLGGGHNLHHLTTTSSATLTIPVYPAR
jgi:hypothetical protein